jgi:hypothetical protein
MPRITLTLEPDLYEQILASKPKRQALSAFCADLIEQQTLGLDSASKLPAYRVGAGTHESRVSEAPTAAEADLGRSASSASDASSDEQLAVEGFDSQFFTQGLEPKKKGGAGGKKISPFTRRTLEPELIPDDLLDCQQLLPEFWAVKKGTRSEQVWNRVCNKLRQWSTDQRREALERAIASGWGDVFEPPSVKAVQGNAGGYVDSITRDRQVRERFLSMFNTEEEAA